ncbi:hypothetical protein C2138_11805 [Salinibacterium hongtaonis]|nr:hypothetical protein C2138_11805 [Salinibacterium hongtaonis]
MKRGRQWAKGLKRRIAAPLVGALLLIGTMLSGAIELFQLLFLPDRLPERDRRDASMPYRS